MSATFCCSIVINASCCHWPMSGGSRARISSRLKPALRAGDQLQQQHRLLRVVAVAIGLALHHQQPRVLIEADARRREARAAGQLTDLHLPESSTSEPVDLQ
jgi:hypothetical protein